MGSDSTPPKTLSDESINRGLVCAHMHSVTWTQKILTFISETGELWQRKHTQHAPSTKTKCDYLNGWIKKWSHICKNLTKMVKPRDIAGERRRRRNDWTGDGEGRRGCVISDLSLLRWLPHSWTIKVV